MGILALPTNLTRRDLLKSGGLAMVAAAAIGSGALAQEAEVQPAHMPTPEGEYTLIDAAQELKEYSLESGGVGIILSYKAWEGGHSAEDIASAFIGNFENNNTEADYRVVEGENEGAAVYFVVQETSQGPYSPNDAWAKVPEIAEQNRAAKAILAASLDPEVN